MAGTDAWGPGRLLALAVLVASCSSTGTPAPVGPPTAVFTDEVACRTVTESSCGYLMCDFVPEGKTLDEVCGPNFREGIQVTDPDAVTSEFLVDQLDGCAVVRVAEDGRWTRDDGIEFSVAGRHEDVDAALVRAASTCATTVDR